MEFYPFLVKQWWGERHIALPLTVRFSPGRLPRRWRLSPNGLSKSVEQPEVLALANQRCSREDPG